MTNASENAPDVRITREIVSDVTNTSENAPDVRITREIVSDVTNTSENAPDVLKNKKVPDLLSTNVTVHDGLNTN